MNDLPAMSFFWKSMEKLRIAKVSATHNIMMAALCDLQKFDEAWKLFLELKKTGLKINILTYNTALHVSDIRFGSDAVEQLWEEIISRGVTPNQMSYVQLLTSLEKAGKVEKAEAKWKEMVDSGNVPPVAKWGKMIDVLGKENLPHRAFSVWKKMRNAKIEPNEQTYA
jgi:pentatricopeptide repeat protein